jgi:transcriptional repressor of cell division inhibition gene dicB
MICIASCVYAMICDMTLIDAIKVLGSRNKIAQALGISRQAITRWKYGIPEIQQYRLEELTKGKLKRKRA